MSDGKFGYRAGTSAATVDLGINDDLKRVTVIAGASAATLTIGGGDTITVPAGVVFDETISGRATNADVVIAGSVTAYYVAWS
jgi:uncharacterized protein YjlB